MSQYISIVSNWKMNLNIDTAIKLVNYLKNETQIKSKLVKSIICPQFLLIPEICKYIKDLENTYLGAQDCHHESSGAYTGCTSIELLKYYKCKYSIIGHSERRTFQNESNLEIFKKAKLLKNNNIIPIICIGEPKNIRDDNQVNDFLAKQILGSIPKKLDEVIIAYEPIWAIGTGITPKNEEILAVRNFIENFLKNNGYSDNISILYGGSVSSSNFSYILQESKVNGMLIGGASINQKEIQEILNYGNIN